MNNEFFITDSKTKFKSQILDLFEKVFQKKMSKNFWNWRFVNNIFGKPISKLAFHNDELIAHYLIHPSGIVWDNNDVNSLVSMTTMTDPLFSGKGIMYNLANQVLEIATLNDFNFIFGFANLNSRYFFVNKLNFKEIHHMSELVYHVKNKNNFESNFKSEIISLFDDSFTDYFKKQNQFSNFFILPRTKEYLNWRYIQHPEFTYFCYKIITNGDIQGFFILKIFEGKKCHIVDFILNDSYDCYQTMMSTVVSFCKKHNIPQISLWVNHTIPLFSFLEKIGFKPILQSNFFVVKSLKENKFNTSLFNFDKWYITMGDSDVY